MKRVFALLVILLVLVGTAYGEPKDWPAPWLNTVKLKIDQASIGAHPFMENNNHDTWLAPDVSYAIDFMPNGYSDIELHSPVNGRIVCCNFPEYGGVLTKNGSCVNGHAGHGGDLTYFGNAYGYHMIIEPDEDNGVKTQPYSSYTKNTFVMGHLSPNGHPPLSDFATSDGQYRVKQGQRIGYMGKTGAGATLHLHFELINRYRYYAGREGAEEDCENVQLFGITKNQFSDPNTEISGGFTYVVDRPSDGNTPDGSYSPAGGNISHASTESGSADTGELYINTTNESQNKASLSINGYIEFSNGVYVSFGGKDINFTKSNESSGTKIWSGVTPHWIDYIYDIVPLIVNAEIELRKTDSGGFQLIMREKTFVFNITICTVSVNFTKTADYSVQSPTNVKSNGTPSRRDGLFRISRK